MCVVRKRTRLSMSYIALWSLVDGTNSDNTVISNSKDTLLNQQQLCYSHLNNQVHMYYSDVSNKQYTSRSPGHEMSVPAFDHILRNYRLNTISDRYRWLICNW